MSLRNLVRETLCKPVDYQEKFGVTEKRYREIMKLVDMLMNDDELEGMNDVYERLLKEIEDEKELLLAITMTEFVRGYNCCRDATLEMLVKLVKGGIGNGI